MGSQIPVAETPAGKTSKPDQFTDHFSFTVVCVPSTLTLSEFKAELTLLGLIQTLPLFLWKLYMNSMGIGRSPCFT